MSTSYWMINGIGLSANEIIPYLNKAKMVQFLIEQLDSKSDSAADLRQMISSGDFSGLHVGDYLRGNLFDNLADLLTHCDDTDSITCGDDGDGNYYFYYPPSMPWDMRDTEPRSTQEVHGRIITAVQKITDLTAEEIDHMINDELSVVGFGRYGISAQ